VRRACALLSVARSTVGYQPPLAARDAPAVAVMHEVAAQYPRYGYRRIQVFMARRGHAMSTDRAHRLGRLHKLQVPRKRPRRRVASARPRPFVVLPHVILLPDASRVMLPALDSTLGWSCET
jgi:putative transposase